MFRDQWEKTCFFLILLKSGKVGEKNESDDDDDDDDDDDHRRRS